ncbi:peptidoglycan bridge formation glycyltransferase FemA/FemB family protein [Methanoplanus sp. FWC-SCC4]|uniref:Peptidoglycan bridge formation glycyltransferase FemA/FemB family protein n=1 Tax=Methanochimaera problematica TaxID=2609417 RepID=A0AA97FE43_9EURY|nr:peptidoglycan bridge formation glycyltransferase FemA/FemB family protein [Methanoplanus sp. FWC-SCC4]WOF16358.1 peptidoglycan bridge formation glycyltransferase FemA/FemB family protein [Methanoplanus sp. FWC-SCC4]
MEIKIANEEDKTKWDDLILFSENGTLYHTWDWLKLMEKHSTKKIFSHRLKATLYPIMVFDGSSLYGVIPLYLYKILSVKFVASPPPGVENKYLGPVIQNNDKIKLHNKYSKFIKFQNQIDYFIKNTLKSNIVNIDLPPYPQDPRSFIWSGYSVEPRHTNIIDLKKRETEIWNNFNKKLRNEIKKAHNEGIIVEEGTKEHIDFIYTTMSENQRIYSSKEFIQEIYDVFYPENLKIFVAKKDNKVLSGLIITNYKNKVDAWIGTPKVSYKGISPNPLIHWACIQWACTNKYNFYEIIDADNPNFFRFKNKFNSELIHYYSMRWYSPKIRISKGIYRAIKPRYK